jgi:hypothetical protein
MIDPMRSGVGYFSRRKDMAALVLVFTFGALLNAFSMVSPVFVLESWLGRVLHVSHEAPVLSMIFVFFLVIEPILLLGLAAWLTQVWGGAQRAVLPLVVQYGYTLAPLGFGIWLAHYSFHFLTGLYTFIPVTQSAVASLGWSVLGEPYWGLTGLPQGAVAAIEFGFLGLGLVGSLLVGYRLAREDSASHPMRIFGVWAGLSLILWVAAVWVMNQPMEMRGNIVGG